MNTNAIAVKKKNNFAGVVPADFKFVTIASKRIGGGSAMVQLGFAPIVNESG